MVLTLLIAQTYKVAFIDMDRIYNEYIDLRDAKEQVLRYKTSLEIKRDSVKHRLDSLQNDLVKQWAMLTDAEKILRWQEIEATKRRLDSLNRDIMRKVEAKSKEVMAPYLKKVRDVAKKIANDMGYSAVADISVAVWLDPQHDITSLVLDELNKAHKAAGLVLKKVIVFPFKEGDARVHSWALGDTAQIAIYKDLSRNPKLDVMAPERVNEVLRSRGYSWQNLDERGMFSIAQAFAPDVYIFGSVKSKSEDRVDVEVALYDGHTGQVVKVDGNDLRTSVSDVQRGIDFSNTVTQLARNLINQYLSHFAR